MASATQSLINKVTVGLYGAAAGGYMNDLASFYFASGNSQLKLVESQVNSSAYKLNVANWPSLDNAGKAAAIVGTLMNTTTGDAYTQGVAAAKAALDAGLSYAVVANSAIDFLATTTDAVYASAKAAFNNRVTYADSYTDAGGSSTVLNTLKGAVNPTSGEAGVTTVLTTAQDLFNGTTGSDVFRSVAGVNVGSQDQTTLNSSDIIDGGAGTDTMVVNLTGANGTGMSYLGGARLKGIETLQIGADIPLAGFDYNVNQGVNEITDVLTVRADQINAGENLRIVNVTAPLPILEWVNDSGTGAAGIVDYYYRAAAVEGAGTNQALSFKNVTNGALDLGRGVETITLSGQAGSSRITLANTNNIDSALGLGFDLGSDSEGGNGVVNDNSLTKVVLTGDIELGKKGTVLGSAGTDAAGAQWGFTDQIVGNDGGFGNNVTRASAANLLSVAATVTEVDASATTAGANVRFVNRDNNAAVNVTFKGGKGNDYVDFQRGNVNATGAEGNDVFAFTTQNPTAPSSDFSSLDSIVGGAGTDTIQLGMNGLGTYTANTTEFNNKSGIDALDLRGVTSNISLADAFVAGADAGTFTVYSNRIAQASDTDASNTTTTVNAAVHAAETASVHNIDITALAANRALNIVGGTGTEVVIADNDSVNQSLSIDAGTNSDNNNVAATRNDTLTLVNGGTFDAGDLQNVKGVDIINLVQNTTGGDVWNLTLTEAFLRNVRNQQTGNLDANTLAITTQTLLNGSGGPSGAATDATDRVNIDLTDLFTNATLASGLKNGIGANAIISLAGLNAVGTVLTFSVGTQTGLTAAQITAVAPNLISGVAGGVAGLAVASNAAAAFTGGLGDDVFTMTVAGSANTGLAGNDTFNVTGFALTAGTAVDGGAGVDTVALDGGAFSHDIAGLTNVETITWSPAAAQTLTLGVDTVVAAGGTLTINAGAAAGAITADLSAETNGSLNVTTGAGADVLTSGTAADTINSGGGADSVTNAGGNDTVNLGAGNDNYVGAAGVDTVVAGAGNYTVATAAGNDSIDLTGVLAGESGLVTPGTGADTITLSTVAGLDSISLAAGQSNVSDLSNIDTIINFNGLNDVIQVGAAGTASFAITVATADSVSFASAINTALATAGVAGAANNVYLVTVSAGAMAGTYLIDDVTGNRVSGDDFVVRLVGASNITAADFGV